MTEATSPLTRPWYNNCRLGAVLSDKEWEKVEDKFYETLPISEAKMELELRTANQAKIDQAKKAKPKKKKSRMKIKKDPKDDPKQPKLTAFFLLKKNEEGYPLHLCKYNKELREHVYAPRGYQDLSMLRKGAQQGFCHHCRLEPCVTEQHYYDAYGHARKMAKESEKLPSKTEVRAETAVVLQKIHCKWMKKRYSKKKPILTCIKQHVNNVLINPGYSESDLSSEDSSDSSDSEEEAEL